jgi:hypothetical protein
LLEATPNIIQAEFLKVLASEHFESQLRVSFYPVLHILFAELSYQPFKELLQVLSLSRIK